MMRSHRRQHLIVWLVLAPVIFGVLIGAIAVRAHTAAAALRTGASR